jgi:hypothetical protein
VRSRKSKEEAPPGRAGPLIRVSAESKQELSAKLIIAVERIKAIQFACFVSSGLTIAASKIDFRVLTTELGQVETHEIRALTRGVRSVS